MGAVKSREIERLESRRVELRRRIAWLVAYQAALVEHRAVSLLKKEVTWKH